MQQLLGWLRPGYVKPLFEFGKALTGSGIALHFGSRYKVLAGPEPLRGAGLEACAAPGRNLCSGNAGFGNRCKSEIFSPHMLGCLPATVPSVSTCQTSAPGTDHGVGLGALRACGGLSYSESPSLMFAFIGLFFITPIPKTAKPSAQLNSERDAPQASKMLLLPSRHRYACRIFCRLLEFCGSRASAERGRGSRARVWGLGFAKHVRCKLLF